MNQELLESAKNLINNNKLQDAENILLGLNNKYSVFELARLRKIQGRYRDAAKLYLKSLSMTSEINSQIDSDINIELGRIYASLGKIRKSKEYYENGLDRICLENNIYRELGEAYLKDRSSDNRYYKEAEKCFEKAIKMFPNDTRTNFYLGIVYRILNKNCQASKIFNKLLAEKEVKANKFLYNKVLNQYEILMRKEYLESKPREMRVTITNKCNIGCRYCDIWKVPDWQLSDERIKEIINYFPYLENMYWLGGETFLYKGFEEILEEGSKYDTLNQTILTNGLLLNERILEKISKSNITLLIAIDAGKKETYEYLRRGASWDKLCKNLELIKEVGQKTNKKIRTIFNAVISKSNYKEMLDMVEMAHKYDFDKIRFMPILGDTEENMFLNKDMASIEYISDLLPILKQKANDYEIQLENRLPTIEKPYYKNININFAKIDNIKNTDLIETGRKINRCIAPWKTIVIDSKGPIRTCVNCNDWLGDLSKQTISEFWNGEGIRFYRMKFAENYGCIGGFDLNMGPNDIVKCSEI